MPAAFSETSLSNYVQHYICSGIFLLKIVRRSQAFALKLRKTFTKKYMNTKLQQKKATLKNFSKTLVSYGLGKLAGLAGSPGRTPINDVKVKYIGSIDFTHRALVRTVTKS